MAPESSRWSIRLIALVGSLVFGWAAAASSSSHGKPWRLALADGSVLALGLIITWGMYHIITRKNNGIIILVLPVAPFMGRIKLGQGTDPSQFLLSSVCLGTFVGALVLATDALIKLRRKKEKPT